MTRPLVFLDFDGVLNSDSWIYSHDMRGYNHIDPSRVALINRLAPHVDFVISSAWRRLYSLPSLRAGLRRKGFKGRIIGVTDQRGPIRGDEIGRWLDRYPAWPPFVILDDNSDMGDLRPYLVQTDPETGVTLEDVKRALIVLNGGAP